MNKYWRTDFWYNTAKFFAKIPIARKFNYSSAVYKLKPPFIVLANHTTDYDAMLIASSFSAPIHFVISDHISSMPFGKAVTHLTGSIPITKSSYDIESIRHIIDIAKNGGAIGIFPEGNKSYCGKMSYIKPSIAKLVKKLNIPVVLFSIEGGYFSSPRWTKNKRKGTMQGKIQKIISPEELQQKSTDEIYDIIKSDLHVDAYENQNRNKVAYVGKDLCKNIESLLYYCPKCHSYDTLYGYRDQLRCKNCDLIAELDEYGYFSFAPFGTIEDWDNCQKQNISKIDFDDDDVVFVDEDCILRKRLNHFKNHLIGKYLMSLQHKKLIFVPKSPKYEFVSLPIGNIKNYAVEGINGLQLCMNNGDVFVIKNKPNKNMIKYVDSICAINNFSMR